MTTHDGLSIQAEDVWDIGADGNAALNRLATEYGADTWTDAAYDALVLARTGGKWPEESGLLDARRSPAIEETDDAESWEGFDDSAWHARHEW